MFTTMQHDFFVFKGRYMKPTKKNVHLPEVFAQKAGNALLKPCQLNLRDVSGFTSTDPVASRNDDEFNVETPEPFPLPKEVSIVRAAAGWTYYVCVTVGGEVYTWGDGNSVCHLEKLLETQTRLNVKIDLYQGQNPFFTKEAIIADLLMSFFILRYIWYSQFKLIICTSICLHLKVEPGSLLQGPLENSTNKTYSVDDILVYHKSNCELKVFPMELIHPPEFFGTTQSLT
ncbi:Regulator of chromosome condensation 1/beta-lactamase-inhibitor protein II [Artemisia annua]|uniref:Regulator of chromosome condensation 1/beta-lactamase-inhibitor protein II n=1 Tax=Artemisia annua TaxID=35608 RepID=A0A2U1PK52_ARTAN|nr:Regulator of chromosome condensation 1/beta-lactamase-inhibitor protein II [Artemisia annua]